MLVLVSHFRSSTSRSSWDPPGVRDLRTALKLSRVSYFEEANEEDRLEMFHLTLDSPTEALRAALVKHFGSANRATDMVLVAKSEH
ncbi:hypothetical protein CC2G_002704 [Coprinopsis cinerea AmutBmut pab1-1]|nr:hypothetical protein CC2G_002704 [Coprinopsis cinerea AmutBmut pab1-1]